MLPLNKSQIPGMLAKGRKLEQVGKLSEAQEIYEDILVLDKNSAHGHFHLGQLLYKSKDLARAIEHLGIAAELYPKEKTIWQVYGRAVAEFGDATRTREFLAEAKKARLERALLLHLQGLFQQPLGKTKTSVGNAPPQEVRRAIELLQKGRAAEAVRVASRLQKAHPKVAIIADILANAQAATGQMKAAEENFRTAQKLDPNYAETRSNYGQFLIEQGRYEEAIPQLQESLRLAPKMVKAMHQLGVALKRNLDTRKAEIVFRRALESDPNNRDVLFELGQMLVGDNEPDEAVELLEKAQRLGADELECLIWIIRALPMLDREAETLALVDRALEISPDNPEVIFSQALLYQKQGQFDDARTAFLKAIDIWPKAGGLYRSFLVTEKLAADDPLIARMEEAFEDPGISDNSRANFGFALAKAMEDSKQYDRVFTYLKPANDLMRKSFPFNIDELIAQSRDIKDKLRDVDFRAVDSSGCTDFAPIFVSGLPRSGTTLVEQIISSHSTVVGGGELGFARRAWGERLIDPKGKARAWSEITPAQIIEAGVSVEQRMRARFGPAERITDKSVQSYSMIGPIGVSLPKARFIITKRDPRDNLLSMYKNVFANGKHLQSYNLRDLALYFHLFEETIAFWQEKLPDWFHVVQYEELIADPEAQSRALIAACGLEWEDQCLSFHENKRRVDTLSVHQVRQPIYSSSMAAWRRYEGDLQEMLEALGGEYAPGKA